MASNWSKPFTREDMIGKKYGKFTVIEVSKKAGKVIAVCECGAKREPFVCNLRRERHYSCGAKACRKPYAEIKNEGNEAWKELIRQESMSRK